MKTALVVSGNDINIFLTAETDEERMALKYISEGKTFEVLSERAGFTGEHQVARLQVNKCQGGWLRAYADKDSIVLCNTKEAA